MFKLMANNYKRSSLLIYSFLIRNIYDDDDDDDDDDDYYYYYFLSFILFL